MEAFRKQQNAEAEKRKLDVKFTPVVFIMKAVAAALEQMPRFNSSLSEDGQRLTLKKYINIGVAVDTPNGLVVPVFKDVNKKSITELSRELTTISKKARDGKLTAGEMQGGCFTISSIGGLVPPTSRRLLTRRKWPSSACLSPRWSRYGMVKSLCRA